MRTIASTKSKNPAPNGLIRIVEDDEAICDSLKLLLEASGYRVETFGSGADFFQTAAPERCDCLILDVNLPGETGFEVLARARERGFATPVIFVSGRPTLTTRAHAERMHAICQLVMTDEAFHHKFGKIWADRTIPHLSKGEAEKIEDWAWEVFQVLLFNLASPDQKSWIYMELGLDPVWVQGAFMEAMTDPNVRQELQEGINIFRVLIKTLLKAGIITDRTRGNYAAFIDMAELHAEGDRMIGDDIAEEGIKYLMQLNGGQMLRARSSAAA